jgi:hypothetical protein
MFGALAPIDPKTAGQILADRCCARRHLEKHRYQAITRVSRLARRTHAATSEYVIKLMRLRWEMYMRHDPVSCACVRMTIIADVEQEPVCRVREYPLAVKAPCPQHTGTHQEG